MAGRAASTAPDNHMAADGVDGDGVESDHGVESPRDPSPGDPSPAPTSEPSSVEVAGSKLTVAGRFKLLKKIGNGSFGNVYLGTDLQTQAKVAVKLEHQETNHPQLFNEHTAYMRMQGKEGIPDILWFGQEGEYWCLAMPLMGPSLHDLFTFCRQRFSLKTTLLLADQILDRIKTVHEAHTLHRDIKPANFIIGNLLDPKTANTVHIIDFGLSRPYRAIEPPHKHIPYREEVNITGTARFASVNTHLRKEQSRRDDLEAILYMLIYFVAGALPWQNMKKKHMRKRKDKHRELAMMKQTATSEMTRNLPSEFGVALKYVRELAFDAEPDYEHLRRLFKGLYVRRGYNKFAFDWSNKPLIGFEDEWVRVPEEQETEAQDSLTPGPGGESLTWNNNNNSDSDTDKATTANVVLSVSQRAELESKRLEQEEHKRKRAKILITWGKEEVKTGEGQEDVAYSPPQSSLERDVVVAAGTAAPVAAAALGKNDMSTDVSKDESKRRPNTPPKDTKLLESMKDCYSAFGF